MDRRKVMEMRELHKKLLSFTLENADLLEDDNPGTSTPKVDTLEALADVVRKTHCENVEEMRAIWQRLTGWERFPIPMEELFEEAEKTFGAIERAGLSAKDYMDVGEKSVVQRKRANRPKTATTNKPYYEARSLARDKAVELWKLHPGTRKLGMQIALRQYLSEIPDVAMPSDATLWDWLKEWPERGEGSVIPPTAQKAGRPKSTGR